MIKKFVELICILALAVFLGCSAFQDVITPAWVSEAAAKYAGEKPTSILPWTTMLDARRIKAKINYVHTLNQAIDELKYGYLSSIVQASIAGGEEFQAKMFSPSGPIGMLFPSAMTGTLCALLIKRPGDKSKKQVRADEKNKTPAG